MLNVALPSVSDDLGVSEMQWVLNGYFVRILIESVDPLWAR